MDSPTLDIEQLIASFLSGNCTLSGKSELEQWVALSDKNKKVFDDSAKIWQNCQTPIPKSEMEHDRLRIDVLIFAQNSNQ